MTENKVTDNISNFVNNFCHDLEKKQINKARNAIKYGNETKQIKLPIIPKWLAVAIEDVKNADDIYIDDQMAYVVSYFRHENIFNDKSSEVLYHQRFVENNVANIIIALKYGYEVENG